MRKYIHIAKGVTPVLTEEAAKHIAEEYSRLRSQEQMAADIARVSGAGLVLLNVHHIIYWMHWVTFSTTLPQSCVMCTCC